jgi:hypothetical protein
MEGTEGAVRACNQAEQNRTRNGFLDRIPFLRTGFEQRLPIHRRIM